MKRFATASLLAALAIVVTASAGQAQTPATPINFGVAAGASLPTGDFGNAVNTGYHATVLMAISPTALPIGVRFEGTYNSFGFQGGGGSAHIWNGNGNITWSMPSSAGAISPYLIGGIGIYNESSTGSGTSQNKFGFNVGGGINMPLSGFKTFIEARYHRVSDGTPNTSYIPISFGVVF